jgi:hypothetical protein
MFPSFIYSHFLSQEKVYMSPNKNISLFIMNEQFLYFLFSTIFIMQNEHRIHIEIQLFKQLFY